MIPDLLAASRDIFLARRWAVALFVLGHFAVLEASAQPVIASPPAAQLVPASLRQVTGNTPPNTTHAPSPAAASRAEPRSPFQWAGITFLPHFTDSFIYSDGLQAQPGRPKNTYINTFSPGFLVDFGSNWTVDYTATWKVYTARAFHETLNHSVGVAGTVQRGDWTGSLSQSYATSSAPLASTARQTGQENVSTSVNLVRRLNYKFSVSISGTQNLSFVNAAPDSYSWSGEALLNYLASTRLTASTGVGFGYTDMNPGANSAFVRPHGQISWRPTEKLSFNGTGGEEVRQIFARGISAKYTPVFSLSGQYSPFEPTSFGLSATRSVTPSVLRNQMTDTTSWSATFSQRLLQHFNFGANYGEGDAGYISTNKRVTAGRKDRSYNYGFNLGTTLLRRVGIGLTYSVAHNASSATGFGFNSHQMGGSISFRY